jgi:homocysteine S-methyltransferase
LEYIRKLDRRGVRLSVMPNAGYPTVLGRRTVYQGEPAYFGDKLAEIVQAGAQIVGGCCGTTPEHIAKAAEALAKPLQIPAQPRREAIPVSPAPQDNPLAEKLDAGRRVVAVELDPPADDDISFFLDGVQALRNAGADAVTIADCPIGRPRADSSLLACKIKRELGVEPLPHMTCRDRNLNAAKALLLGLSMEGVHNVLLVTGDPIPSENRDEVKSVFNFNSRTLARYVAGLNETVLRTPFRLFGALNLNAKNFTMQLKIAREKEDNGITGFLTQPVLSKEALNNLVLARQTLRGKILAGIYPVVSYKNACFLNNEIAGMRISSEITARYEGKNREEAEDLAVRISTAIAGEAAPFSDGFYLMTPFKRVPLMVRILEQIQ